MARPNEKARRSAKLQCSKYDDHRYRDDTVPQVRMYVIEQDEPTEWRIEEGTGLRCRVCGAEIDLSRSQPL
jgi:RNA polymerase-binding transcription factor DksA